MMRNGRRNTQMILLVCILYAIQTIFSGFSFIQSIDAASSSEKVERLSFNVQGSVFLHLGEPTVVKVFAIYSDGSKQDISEQAVWSSSNSHISVQAGRIVADTFAKTTVTARFGGKAASIVADATVIRLQLNHTELLLKPGQQENLKLIAFFADGTTKDATGLTKWETSNDGILVDTAGQIVVKKIGKATITATYAGLKVQCKVNVQLKSLEISQNKAEMIPGKEIQLVVTAKYVSGETEDVTDQAVWISNNPNIRVSGGKVSVDLPGNAVILASFGGKTVKTIIDASVRGLSAVNTKIQTKPGDLAQLSVTATYAGGKTADVTNLAAWSSKMGAITVVNGLVQTNHFVKGTIVASYGGKSISFAVDAALRGLSFDARKWTAKVDDHTVPVLTAVFADGTAQNVSGYAAWDSSGPSVRVFQGTLDALSAGTSVVTAVYGGKTAKLPVSVALKDGAHLIFTLQDSVSPDPVNAQNIFVGDSLDSVVTVNYGGANQSVVKGVVIVSSNPAVVAVGPNNKVTALGTGTAILTAKYSGKQSKLKVTVINPVATNLIFNFPSSLLLGSSVQSTVSVQFSNKVIRDVQAWTSYQSSSPAIASVNNNGLVTGVSGGDTVITATYGSLKSTVSLNVYGTVVTALTVTPDTISLLEGDSVNLNVTALFSDNSTKIVNSEAVYSSVDSSVATSTGGTVIGIHQGETDVYIDYGGIRTVYHVQVNPNAALIANPGFEQGAASGWSSLDTTGTGTTSVVVTPVSSGSQAMEIVGENMADGQMVGVYQVLDAKPGQPLSLSAMINAVSLNGAKVSIDVDFSDANYGSAGPSLQMEYTSTTNGYIPLNLQGTVPSNAVKIWIYVMLRGAGSNNGSGTVYVDEVRGKYGVDRSPLEVVQTDPIAGALNTAKDIPIHFIFNKPVTLADSSAVLLKLAGAEVPSLKQVNGNLLTIQPTQLLFPGGQYSVEIGASGIVDNTGAGIANAYMSSFTTDPNVIANPGFEQGAAGGWSSLDTTGTGTTNAVSMPVGTGNQALKITGMNMVDGQMVGVYQVLDAKPGQPLSLSAMINAVALNGAKVWVDVDFSDVNYGSAGPSLQVEYTSATNGYMPINLQGTVPANAVKIWVYVMLREDGSNNGSGTVYVDDVRAKYGVDTQSLAVIQSDPTAGAIQISKDVAIHVVFNKPVTLADDSGVLLKLAGAEVPSLKQVSGNLLTIQPIQQLLPGGQYTVEIGTGGIVDSTGAGIANVYTSGFTTDPNIMVNSSFEQGITTGWLALDTTGTGTTRAVNTPVASGNQALKIAGTNMADGQMVGVFQVLDAQPNQPLALSAMVNAAELNGAKVWIAVDFSDANHGSAGPSLQMEYTTTTGGYIPIHLTGLVPATATKLWIYVMLRGNGQNVSGTMYADDVKLNYGVDSQAPAVDKTDPVSGAVNIDKNASFHVVFNKPILLTDTTKVLMKSGNTEVPTNKQVSGNLLTFQPSKLLLPGTVYTLEIDSGGITDNTGTMMTSGFSGSFTTDDNLLANPGFEQGLSESWFQLDTSGSGAISEVNSPVVAGSQALQITSTNMADGQMVGVYEVLDAKPGQSITVSAMVYAPELNGTKVWVDIDFSDLNHGSAGPSLQIEQTAVTNGYIPITVQGVVPMTATKMWLYIILRGNGNANSFGTFYIDNIKLN